MYSSTTVVVRAAEMHHANFKICIRTVKTIFVVNSDLQLSDSPCRYLAGREIRRSLAVRPADLASTLRYDPASFTECDYFDPIIQLVYDYMYRDQNPQLPTGS